MKPPWPGGVHDGGEAERRRDVMGEVSAAVVAADLAATLAARLASVAAGGQPGSELAYTPPAQSGRDTRC